MGERRMIHGSRTLDIFSTLYADHAHDARALYEKFPRPTYNSMRCPRWVPDVTIGKSAVLKKARRLGMQPHILHLVSYLVSCILRVEWY